MATLKIEKEDRELDGGGSVCVISVTGSVDTGTKSLFIEKLAEFLGTRQVAVLHLAGMTYINSGGIAALVRTSGAMQSLVLAGVDETISSLLDTMGLLPVLAIEPDVDAALARLARGGEPGGPPAGGASFPLRFSCDSCLAEIVADSAGKYRCPRCQSCFEVTPEGEVSTFALRSAQSVELSLPCAPAYADVARKAASAVADSVEIPSFSRDAQAIDHAVDEAVGLYTGKAGEGDRRIRMFVAADSREVRIAFLATDPALTITPEDQDGLTFQALEGIVDECVIEPLEPEGHVLRLVKKIEG